MYFIAVVLPAELDLRVLEYKKWMLERYGCLVGLKSPAHLTLVAPFWMEEEQESRLMKDMEHLSRRTPFEMSTRHFAAFPPRTIFIEPEPCKELRELKEEMDAFFAQRQAYKMKQDNRPFHPHITIATRDLRKKDFEEAWTYFEGKTFVASWMVEGLCLLRHNQKKWDVIYTSHWKYDSGKN